MHSLVPRAPIVSQAPSLRVRAAAVLVAAALVPAAARAVEPFAIEDIRVEGLQRTDPGTVFAALPFRIGDTYSDERAAGAIRSLFATGLFKDARIEVDGRVVVVVVDERPVIENVSFVGIKEFDKDTLTKSLKDAGIGEGLPFDRALVDRAEQEIKRQYLTRSLYGAEVVTTITPTTRNRVNVTFTMTEGDAARIREIRILGSKAFSEGTLLDLMELRPVGWLTWYTKNDRYSRAKLNADLETIRSWYLNRGYLEFAVENAQVTISPDKQDVAITITVKEGQPYVVTGIKLEGEYFDQQPAFEKRIRIHPGEPYRAAAVTATTKGFQDLFASYGYAFAKVEARPEIDRANGQVALTLVSDPQRRVYVRRIDVAGNTRTRDEVVRRELRQLESSWYDGDRIKLSRDRVERLGYFKEVNVDTTEVPGTPDQVDLTYNVVEKPTGNLMLGLTYSNTDRIAFTASVRQDNVFGSGNYLGIDLNTSRYMRNVVFSTVDPYYTVDGISRAIDVYYRTSRPYNSLGSQYQLATIGSAIRFGVPFSEFDTVFFGIGVEQTRIGAEQGIPEQYFRYRRLYGANSTAFPLTLGWTRDQRDNVLTPTAGRLQRVNVEWSPVGDVRYMRTNAQYTQYFQLSPKFSLGVNGEIGWGSGQGGRPFPVFKNFYGGGLGSVRAFEQNSLGVIDPTGAYIGGARRINLNTELYVPVPGAGNDKSLRVFLFGDIGNVWRDGEQMTWDSLRSSAGLGLSWVSPVGPLKLSYGLPVRKQPTDRIQRFQFQIGTAF